MGFDFIETDHIPLTVLNSLHVFCCLKCHSALRIEYANLVGVKVGIPCEYVAIGNLNILEFL